MAEKSIEMSKILKPQFRRRRMNLEMVSNLK
jgi:hypothetical protein